MPKQILKIDQFHGGVNSNSDPRDIMPNELSEAIDVMVDELGKIRTMGGTTSQGTASRSNSIEPGYGLFQFSNDRIDGHTLSTGAETGADYFAFSDPDTDGKVHIYSAEDTAWGNPITGMTDNTGGLRKDTFFYVDGVLRVSDGNFKTTNTNKWYGYINRSHFTDVDGNLLAPGGSADTYDAWFVKEQEVAAPTRGLASTMLAGVRGGPTSSSDTHLIDTRDSSGVDGYDEAGAFANFTTAQIDGKGYLAVNSHASRDNAHVISARDSATTLDIVDAATDEGFVHTIDIYSIYPPPGLGFNVTAEIETSSSSTWANGTYEIATTFIYDGDQESLPFETRGNFKISNTDQYPQFEVLATSPYDPRITGGRVYYRLWNSSEDWKLAVDIDLYKGLRASDQSSWSHWIHETNHSGEVYLRGDFQAQNIKQDLANTYQLLSGADQELNTLVARFKTSVVANRMTYIGHIKTTNKDNETEVMGDAMIKSPVGKFDVFPLNRIVEASVRDGDEIVKLEEYADRILQFKKNKMHLINVSQDIEFLEDTFMHKGVSHPAATCKTDFGIAWVNKLGCYLYDGKQVSNLLEKEGRQIIKESDWAAFTAYEPMIGYIPKKRQLLVANDVTTTGDGATFLYDIVTQSWVKGSAATVTSENKTNFITDWNGDLIYSHTNGTGEFLKWSDTSASTSAFSMITQDIDFGQPGQRKKIHKVYVTYRSGNNTTHVQVYFDVDGGTALDKTFANGTNFASNELAIADGWQVAELKPTTSSEANNKKSFRLKFSTDSTVPAEFAINDISIIYRMKHIK